MNPQINDLVIDLKHKQWGVGNVTAISNNPHTLMRLTVEFKEVGLIETYTADGRYTAISEPSLKRILI